LLNADCGIGSSRPASTSRLNQEVSLPTAVNGRSDATEIAHPIHQQPATAGRNRLRAYQREDLIMELSGLHQDFYSLDEFARRHQIGLTTIYAEIKAGRLTARKIGRRTVIAVNDAEAWREQLPRVQLQGASK
jgi:hypothetical protein